MANFTDQEKLRYEQALAAKRRELGVDPNSSPKSLGQVIGSAPKSESEEVQFARPDVFKPALITGCREKWDSFNTTVHPEAAKVKTTVGKWFNEAAPEGRSCLLEGNFGTGKTHLAQALAEAYPFIRGVNNGVALINEVHYLERLKESWNDSSSERMRLDDFLLPYILIFDDLGAYETRDAKWLQNIYYNIFDGRCERSKPTLFLTNLALEKDHGYGMLQDRLGDRNFDRLLGAITIWEPYPGTVLGRAAGKWHAEMYDQPSARSGNIYTSAISKAKEVIKSVI